ncbi:Calpain-5 [Folsomia candida]|uniref:Calpain-5 n=2 Tax=Folsomia candida TaxID=158441 RepID=A0A226DI85_FOLCA|nr:Calpain-5 [Folsomia candida]
MEDFNLLDALSDITSGFPQQISIPVLQESDEERIVSSDVIHIKEIMNNTLAEGSLMCCSILVREPSEQSAITESGLVPVHNYVVTATKEIHLDCTGHQSMFKTGEKILLVRLRHPWGSKEWNGPFSEESLEWTRIEIGERNKLGLVFEEDSEFWMPFEDFISKFDLLTICHIKSHSILPSLHKGRPMWHEAVALGAWTRPNHAGGAYSSIGKDAWLHNPQYRLDVSHPKIELILELVQKEQQLHDGTPHYTKVGFNILKVEENREHRIHKVSNPPIITSDYVQGRNVVWKGDLTKGRYVLIPTTHEPHIAAEFMIRLHSDTEIKLSELIDDYPDPFLNCPPFVTKPVAVTQITVVGATGLAECENTFCIVKVEGESLQSEIVYNSREPQWGLQGIFYRKDVCKPVIVECWESKPQHFDRFLGSAVLSGESDNEMISLKKSLVGKGDKRTELHPGEIEVLIATYDDLMAI